MARDKEVTPAVKHESLKGLSSQMEQGFNVISIDRYLYQDLPLFVFSNFNGPSPFKV